MSSFGTNPIVVDAAMTAGFRSSYPYAGGFPGPLRIQKIQYLATAAGSVVITDPISGDTLFTLEAEAAGSVELNFFAAPRVVADFEVSTLPNGSVEIYLA